MTVYGSESGMGQAYAQEVAYEHRSGGGGGSSAAVGWITFAAVVMMMIGVFQSIAGISGIANDKLFFHSADYTFSLDTTQWGWIHLIMGIIVFVAGIGLFTGNVLARTIGVVIAAGSAIANFMWMPYYPVWSIVMIALDVAVIWALTAHGRDASRAMDY